MHRKKQACFLSSHMDSYNNRYILICMWDNTLEEENGTEEDISQAGGC